MEYVITQTGQTKANQVSLTAPTVLLAPGQQMLTAQRVSFSVERNLQDENIEDITLEVELLMSDFVLLKETDLFGLKELQDFSAQSPVRLYLRLRPSLLIRMKGQLRHTKETEEILKTRGPEEFPFFLQLSHYELDRLTQIEQRYEF